ncbi:LysE family translocator [Musicola paradisiaca]|uniref:Lysine exporter protein (LYSE/YGGA) n=1 Tax=Musicola paradisiaca (strain Ech703) TaxID=579405 RepID=C6C5P7_MUSP7|nr:LysE family translocator [Musicola paradisiaca]ACS83860.1 Lysine exporter protein (LYSE/YGGA) [Musicola paradisiaca Ech703]
MVSLDFLAISLLVVISPGTGTLITLTAGLQYGMRGAWVAAAGCTLGVLPHMLAVVTGLAALYQASALVFDGVKFAGVGYLLFMSWQALRDKTPLTLDADSEFSGKMLVYHAVTANLLNPKLTVFFLAFLPQFVSEHDRQPVRTMLLLSAIFAGITFWVFVGYGAMAVRFRRHVVMNPRVFTAIRWLVAAAFTGLAVKLAVMTR